MSKKDLKCYTRKNKQGEKYVTCEDKTPPPKKKVQKPKSAGGAPLIKGNVVKDF